MPKGKPKPNPLDKIWRDHVLYRWPSCAICGKTDGRLNAHHLIPREFKEFRWDVDNGMTLCVSHHTFGKLSAHKNPMWFVMWMHKYQRDRLTWIYDKLRDEIRG